MRVDPFLFPQPTHCFMKGGSYFSGPTIFSLPHPLWPLLGGNIQNMEKLFGCSYRWKPPTSKSVVRVISYNQVESIAVERGGKFSHKTTAATHYRYEISIIDTKYMYLSNNYSRRSSVRVTKIIEKSQDQRYRCPPLTVCSSIINSFFFYYNPLAFHCLTSNPTIVEDRYER